MRRLAFAGLALGVSAGVAPLLGAQPARFDTALVRTYTLGALVSAARMGDSVAAWRTANPAAHGRLAALLARLERPELTSLPLILVAQPEQVTGPERRARLEFVARAERPEGPPGLARVDGAAIDTLAMLMAQELPRALEPVVGEDSTDRLLAPLEAFNFARRNQSIATSLEKLRRFERKFGPGSPRLNVVEVLLNYGAQWLPGFAPNNDGWPGSLEVVASYVPTYLTIADGSGRAVSIAELGLRRYLWGRDFGTSVFKPGYFSLGLALAGERDGALASPWRGDSRLGAFFGWGGAKLAYVGGRDKRLLITRQMHIVPWVS